ncbi:response regulator with CheY-like receiver domain and winged-helix DNA-binding domain [Cyanobium gracile PCC 6307]|uniref:Response regulator with CheY-like receiver domain and winged-helix DNA-binding domain n=2 Tax=Cyanobium gracile TaxID=59930 RepID=K9P4I1_CYAGP|nr:response regulator with CheY-like receiver domain and winged-helix DNA-binding domain [Cyanobium gracile PCC 6307]
MKSLVLNMQFERIDPAKILLVEDDPNDVELIKLALENHKVVNQIDVVTDGEQALNYLHELSSSGLPARDLPRLTLLDLKLPKIDGITVLERIRNEPRTRDLIVVVMTSSSENQDLKACYQLGVNSYVVKPLGFNQFMDVSRQVGCYWMMLNQVAQTM